MGAEIMLGNVMVVDFLDRANGTGSANRRLATVSLTMSLKLPQSRSVCQITLRRPQGRRRPQPTTGRRTSRRL